MLWTIFHPQPNFLVEDTEIFLQIIGIYDKSREPLLTSTLKL